MSTVGKCHGNMFCEQSKCELWGQCTTQVLLVQRTLRCIMNDSGASHVHICNMHTTIFLLTPTLPLQFLHEDTRLACSAFILGADVSKSHTRVSYAGPAKYSITDTFMHACTTCYAYITESTHKSTSAAWKLHTLDTRNVHFPGLSLTVSSVSHGHDTISMSSGSQRGYVSQAQIFRQL